MPADFTKPTKRIISEIGLTLLLPLALGMLYLYLYPRTAAFVSKWCIRGSLLGVAAIVIGSMSAGRLDAAAFGTANILLVLVFTLALWLMGWSAPRLLRLPHGDATAIETEVVVRNINLGVMIKASLFPAATGDGLQLGDTVLFTLLLYGGFQLFAGAALITLNRRKAGKAAQSPSAGPV